MESSVPSSQSRVSKNRDRSNLWLFGGLLVIVVFLVVAVSFPLNGGQLAALFPKASSDAAALDTEKRSGDVGDVELELKQYLRKDQKSRQQTLGSITVKAQKRKERLLKLFQDEPNKVAVEQVSPEVLKQMPDELKGLFEKEVTLAGTVRQRAQDDFVNKKTDRQWVLVSDDKKEHFLYGNGLKEHDHDQLVPESRVTIEGLQLDETILVNKINDSVLADNSPPGAGGFVGTGNKKVAAILMNYQNNPVQPYTVDQVRSMLFTGPTSVNAFVKESSYNKTALVGNLRADGDVFGWVTSPKSDRGCDLGYNSTNAIAAAAASGYVDSNYQYVVVVTPGIDCPYGGGGYIKGKYSWANTNLSDLYMETFVFAHELGHNFGAHHANRLVCTDANGQAAPLGNNCSSREYGDWFDVMGETYKIGHFNNFVKRAFGWLASSNIQTVTSGALTTYTIEPTEKNTSGVNTLVIPLPGGGSSYYIEYRQPIGFDQFISSYPGANGIAIRKVRSLTSADATDLIDMAPTTLFTNDARLTVGQTLTDSTNSIVIKNVGASATSAQVQVSYTPSWSFTGNAVCANGNAPSLGYPLFYANRPPDPLSPIYPGQALGNSSPIAVVATSGTSEVHLGATTNDKLIYLKPKSMPHSSMSAVQTLGANKWTAKWTASALPISTTPYKLDFTAPVTNCGVFKTTADAYVQKNEPDDNNGTHKYLEVDKVDSVAGEYQSYMKFKVSGVTKFVKVTLEMLAYDASDNAPKIYKTSTSWDEKKITWANKPSVSSTLMGDYGRFDLELDPQDDRSEATYIEYDLTSTVKANGDYAFVLVGDSSDGIKLASRESSSPPRLRIQME